jgi:hypothetical protein
LEKDVSTVSDASYWVVGIASPYMSHVVVEPLGGAHIDSHGGNGDSATESPLLCSWSL